MNKKESFFKKVVKSIKSFEKYPEFATNSWQEVLSYLIILLIVFAIIISIAYAYKISKQINQILDYIQNEIPNFTFENNELKFERESAIIKENTDNIIIIDTSENAYEIIDEYKEKIQDKENGIILLKDKVLIKANLINRFAQYDYKAISQSYEIETLNKQDLLGYFNKTNLILIYIGFFIISFIYIFLLYIISIWLDIILLTSFGCITALFMRLRIRFAAMCKIAIHSLTLPILLNIIVILVESFTNFRVKYFESMYIGIAYIYIIATILMIKSDIIKNQQELLKILEEQEKIRREQERQEEQNNEKEDKNKDNKESNKDKRENKEKKENKEDKQDDNLGKEPQGENA